MGKHKKPGPKKGKRRIRHIQIKPQPDHEIVKMGRPPDIHTPLKQINYELVASLGRWQCTQEETAAFIGFSEHGFIERKKTDERLAETLGSSRLIGRVMVRRNIFNSMLDRYFTTCKDCDKVKVSFEKFYDACPTCKSPNVKQHWEKGDPKYTALFATSYLGMSSKPEITESGSQDTSLMDAITKGATALFEKFPLDDPLDEVHRSQTVQPPTDSDNELVEK
jgi:hypothetical protein